MMVPFEGRVNPCGAGSIIYNFRLRLRSNKSLETNTVNLTGWLLILSSVAAAQSRSMTDEEIRSYLPRLIEPGHREANIGAADGQYLHDLVIKLKAKRVLEVGTAHGYSALWLAMALRKTDGRLTTLEIHEGHQAIARQHLAATGFESLVDARLADARRAV